MTPRQLLRGATFALCVTTLSCGAHGNPILGRWTAKDQNGMFVPSDVEFTATEQITGMSHERRPVTYQINEQTVTVVPKGAMPRRCTVSGADTMICEGMGEFVRVK